MKRLRFILLAFVVAMVLMGAGYAAWTQSFTVKSTVSTGELFVDVEVGEATFDIYDGGAWNEDVSVGGLTNVVTYELGDTNSDGNETYQSITFTIEKMFPGTRVNNTITLKNIGSVNVSTVKDPGEGFPGMVSHPYSPLWGDLVFKIGENTIDGPADRVKMSQLAKAIRTAAGGMKPGEEKTITISQELPWDSDDDTENCSITWTVYLQFEQDNS